MKGVRKAATVLGIATMAAAAAAALIAASSAQHRVGFDEFAAISTPPGITLQPTGKYQGYGLDQATAALIGHAEVVYADARGLTLYTYDKDQSGKIACLDECARTWPPLLADKGARPVRDWSIVMRPDGTRQWALGGKPVYTYTKDEDPGSIGGNSSKRYGRGPNIGERGAVLAKIADDTPLPQGWHAAYHYPATLADAPPDVDIKEVEDAAGLVLVNSANLTLYAFGGDPNADAKACPSPCPFRPVVAPLAAAAKGEFAPFDRADGERQWTYQGLGLYSYDGDLVRGDANGQFANKQWRAAYVARDFLPSGITVQKSHRLGFVLATATGQTLYRRDAYLFQSGSGHGERRGVLIRPAVGRDLNTDPHCAQDCEHWHPLLAAADARPQGYWDVYARADGSKQWAFQGYALWTYDGDKKPGDINGNDSWQVAGSMKQASFLDLGTPLDTVPALYWAAMAP